jgi:hypothetical protein
MALMAEFKTAYLQREVALDVKVAADVKVGQVCKLANDTITASTASAVAVGDVIIAQSDMTVGQGHIKIENRDHNYSDKVAASTDKKHVMVFVVSDPSDIIPKTV